MAAGRPFAVLAVVLAGAAASACTSTGRTETASLSATATEAYPPLPEEILTVPAATDTAQAESGGPIAEASVLKPAVPQMAAVAAAAPQAADPAAKQVTALAQADPQGAALPAAAIQERMQTTAANGGPAQETVALASAGYGEALPMAQPAAFAGSTPSGSLLATAAIEPRPAAADAIEAPAGRISAGNVAPRSPELDSLIARYASYYKVPLELVRRTIKRESTFNPGARNGPYWGLMQISHRTAQGMGYRGPASGLLDAETNLKYAVRYLRGAWLVARGDHARADRLYQTGYYYDAKRMGLLDETGLGTDRRRRGRTLQPLTAALGSDPL